MFPTHNCASTHVCKSVPPTPQGLDGRLAAAAPAPCPCTFLRRLCACGVLPCCAAPACDENWGPCYSSPC
eukprot:1161038-Pelagomonas_calceolata.AAC.3